MVRANIETGKSTRGGRPLGPLPVRFLAVAVVFVVAAVGVGWGTTAHAAALRYQVDQRGDFVLFGNTVARDCGSGVPNPVVGTNGACGSNTTDTGADVFWRADDPSGGAAAANNTITVDNARSTAVLILPAGATVTYARLYWSAQRNGATNDTTATIERPGVFAQTTINADVSVAATSTNPVGVFYQSTASVTALVQTHGAGAYRVGGIDTVSFSNLNSEVVYGAWSMVVFYRLDSDPPRNLALFDGLDLINSGGPAVTVTLSGFVVPNAGFDAKLGVITYEGDDQYDGDSLSFNGVALSDARNPSNDFFNGTRSYLGAAVSNAGDLPQLTGNTRSMGGFDLDVVDVKARLTQGDTSATITASTDQDFYLLGAFVTSVSTFKPDFSGATKTMINLTRGGSTTRPGDIIEYTIAATNTGNDPATRIVLNDPLPTGVTFVPGSIRVVVGPNMGTKTDVADGDQGEYLSASRTVRVRLGTGANGTTGGSLAINTSSTVAFRVTVDASATGTIANQATITATGQSGAPPADYVSDGNGPAPGTPPTSVPVDECIGNVDCPGAKPRCLTTPDPNVCVVCLAAADCPGAAPVCDPATRTCRACAGNAECPGTAPACQPGGACGQCSATNPGLCSGTTPVCDPTAGTCVECLTSANCGGGLPVCNPAMRTCVGCLTSANCSGATPVCGPATLTCRGCSGDGECGGATPACQPNGRCGVCSASNAGRCTGTTPLCEPSSGICVGCRTSSDCAGSTPVCDPTARVCRGCTGNGDCSGATPACGANGICGQCSATHQALCTGATPVCDVAGARCVQCLASASCAGGAPVCNPTTHACVACLSSADCSGLTPVCSQTTQTCGGCTGNGAPSCPDPARPACQSTGPLAGSCTECAVGFAGRCGGAKPVCLAAQGLCGCTDTDGDTECGGATSGIVCNGAVGICVPGCGQSVTRNACPTGQVCVNIVGGVGSCRPPGSCGRDADCTTPPLSRCDTTVSPGRCVQCLNSIGCNSPLVCDVANTKTCVECVTGQTASCSANMAGARCLTNGTCGCAADGECGDNVSGRICDTNVGKCATGCRGVGGNGCSSGDVCTSTSGVPGSCVPLGSGGAGGGAGGSGGGGGGGGSAGGRGGGGTGTGAVGVGGRGGTSGGGSGGVTDGGIDSRDGAAGPDGGTAADGGLTTDAGRPDGGVDGAAGEAGIGIDDGYLGGGGCACATEPGGVRAPSSSLALSLVGFSIAFFACLSRRRRRCRLRRAPDRG